MTVEQTKIVVKPHKCSMAAGAKPPDEQRRSVQKNSRAFFGMSKETIDSGQLICGSPGLKPPTAELVAAPLRIVGAPESPHFPPPQCARIYSGLHTVSPAKFITTLKRPATTPSVRTLAAQIRTSQPTLRSHVCAPADGCAVISDTPRRLSPFRGIRNRTLRCRRG